MNGIIHLQDLITARYFYNNKVYLIISKYKHLYNKLSWINYEVKKMDRKIIIPVIIVLIVALAAVGVILQNRNEIPPVRNITVNETPVAPNVTRPAPPEPIEPPANKTIQVKISKEEAMRIAEEALVELGPPETQPKSVDARLFQLREEHMKGWSPENRDMYRYRRHPIWIWNVTMRYPEGVLPDGEIYGDRWVDAQTGRALVLMAQ
jgi:hypothetical protein